MSFLLRFFRPKSEISTPMEVVHAVHLGTDLKWEFDPQYDAKDIFQKLQIIGKGGFGTVCKVMHIPSQTILAGKLINPKLVNSPNSKKEIEHEIELMKEVESDYTIHYYGSVQFEGSMMILMEYCDCGSLRNILDAREQVLSEDQIAIVMRDLLIGLHIIHTRYRIVHRDIKAANILLTSSGGIRIADFGVSRRFEKTGTIHTMTIVGTPYWMAPEVINGTAYSFPADLWSVGITAVELSEGAPPYVELAPTKAMIEIFVKGFPGYRFKKMHSPEFMDFVSHCVQKKDVDRWDIPHLLEHPFIKRAERMPRVEVLGDLIKCGLKITKSQPSCDSANLFSSNVSSNNYNSNNTNSNLFSFSTQKNASSAPNLNSATNFDTFGSSGYQNRGGNIPSGARFDSFSIGAGGSNGFNSAALNSGTNFNQPGVNLRSAQGFDSFTIGNGNDNNNNNNNNFDSAALTSGTSFDSFAASYNNNGFDSAALNSGTSFDSFAAAHKNNGFDSAALNSGAGFDSFSAAYKNNGFDSAALNSGTSFDSFAAAHKNNGFDSAALNSGAGFDSFSAAYKNNGFDSAALNSGTSFDSFAAAHKNNGFDSAALNSGTNFGVFPAGKANNGFDSASLSSSNNFGSFAANRNGADLKPSTGFDSFAATRNNGFDSAALNSSTNFNNFMPTRGANLKSSAGFDSFAANYGKNNGFDSAALNSGTNYGVFVGGNGNGFDSASLNSGANFNSFVQTNGANLKSSAGFDSFAANYNQSGEQKQNPQNAASFDSFARGGNSNGFDSFARGGNSNGFDSFARGGNSNGFDSFVATPNNGFDSVSLDTGSNFVSPYAANQQNQSGFDSFASANGANIQSSAGFDSFAAPGQNRGFDSFSLNSGNNFMPIRNAEMRSSGFNSFVSTNESDSKSSDGFEPFEIGVSKSGSIEFNQPDQNQQQQQKNQSQAQQSQNQQQQNQNQAQQSQQQQNQNQALQSQNQNQQQQVQAQSPQLSQTEQQQSQTQQAHQQNQPNQAHSSPHPIHKADSGPVSPVKQPIQDHPTPPIAKHGSGPIPQFHAQHLQQVQTLQARRQVQFDPSQVHPQQPKSKEDIPHVTFSLLPDHVYRQVARMNSLRTPYVNYDSVIQSAKEGKPLPPVNYQQDDSLIMQQRRRQQGQYDKMMKRQFVQPYGGRSGEEEEEEQIPTWSPPKSIVAFLLIVAFLYGPEGFVLSMMLIIAVYFAVSYGSKKVVANKGLVPRNFQKN